MNKGIFCISIDHELLWGRHDLNYKKFTNKVKKEREIIKKILYLFNKYEIPATWAIVGKIMEKGNNLWHGRDTINQIKKVKNQELAFHSYSHKIFSEISETEANKQINTNKIGSFFVFPKNKIAYLHLLRKSGFKSYRGEDIHKNELLFPFIPPVYTPIKKDKLLNIPGSMYFVSSRGLRILIPFGLRYLKIRLGLNKAIKKGEIFHLWFHPIDFVDNSKLLLKEFELILKHASNLQKRGFLDIFPISGIVEKYK